MGEGERKRESEERDGRGDLGPDSCRDEDTQAKRTLMIAFQFEYHKTFFQSSYPSSKSVLLPPTEVRELQSSSKSKCRSLSLSSYA